MYPEIYAKLGKVSIGTLQRWKRILGNSNNYELLIPNYHYEDYSRTRLTDYEKQIFLKLLLHPNKFSIGKSISLTQYVLKTQGQEHVPAPPTFRRFANWYKANYFDKWTLLRDGEKALKEQVIPHIKRDVSKIEVGEIKDVEDYKQKIQKQKQLKNKTIKACKEFLNIEDLGILECELLEEKENAQINKTPHPSPLPQGARKKFKYNPAIKPLFKTSRERYEYLMEYGCICNDDRIWLATYKKSKEYKQYETNFC